MALGLEPIPALLRWGFESSEGFVLSEGVVHPQSGSAAKPLVSDMLHDATKYHDKKKHHLDLKTMCYSWKKKLLELSVYVFDASVLPGKATEGYGLPYDLILG